MSVERWCVHWRWSAERCLCSLVCHRWRKKWTFAWHQSPPSGTLCAAVALKHSEKDKEMQLKPRLQLHSGLETSPALRKHSSRSNNSTSFGVLHGGLRCPRSCFYVTSLLKCKHEASVTDNDLSCIQALQNALRVLTKWKKESVRG